MAELTKEPCVACRAGEPRVEGRALEELLAQVPGWKVAQREGIPRLEKAYEFEDFSQALAFTVQVGLLAEREDHHPAILTEWGRVTVAFWTHKIKGLHRNDFIAAAKTDAI